MNNSNTDNQTKIAINITITTSLFSAICLLVVVGLLLYKHCFLVAGSLSLLSVLFFVLLLFLLLFGDIVIFCYSFYLCRCYCHHSVISIITTLT